MSDELSPVNVVLADDLDNVQAVVLAAADDGAAARAGAGGAGAFPCEMLELIPYAGRLERRQTGADFLGLDSGFAHYNRLCNGLDTGLTVLAAPPGRGKTSFLWQIACQAAQLN